MLMEVTTILTFSVLALSMTATPGPNMFLVIHHVAGGSLIQAGLAIAGICSAVIVHGLLMLAGLSLLMSSSPFLLLCLNLMGAAYIFYLGIQAVRAYLGTEKNAESFHANTASATFRNQSIAFRHGFFTGILNPYTSIFIITVMPQFLLLSKNPLPLDLGLLMIILVSIKIVWFGGLALLLARLKKWVSSVAFTRLLNLSSGVALILLSLGLMHKAYI